MYDSLITHVVTLLEFEQTPKDFLDLKIYRVFIKPFNQIKEKKKKREREERKTDKDNGKESHM